MENSYLIDTESGAEMARLIDLNLVTTQIMGGLFPASLDLSSLHTVLDIGCGPGGWALEVARQYSMSVTGIDISKHMIEYARTRAQVQRLPTAAFLVMDATQPLKFADHTFDLINVRFAVGYMLPKNWLPFLQECKRLLRPGGVLVLTDGEGLGQTDSPAYGKLCRLFIQSMHRAGRTFTDSENAPIGITAMLPSFLAETGFQRIESILHEFDYSAGMPAHYIICENFRVGLQLVKPFFLKIGVTTSEEFDHLYEQTQLEMLSPDFKAASSFQTSWGFLP